MTKLSNISIQNPTNLPTSVLSTPVNMNKTKIRFPSYKKREVFGKTVSIKSILANGQQKPFKLKGMDSYGKHKNITMQNNYGQRSKKVYKDTERMSYMDR